MRPAIVWAAVLALLFVATAGVAQEEDEQNKPTIPMKSRIEAGVTGTQGNSETFDLRSYAESVYKNDDTRLKIDGSYYYGSAEEKETGRDVITRNEYNYGLINDWYFPEAPFSVFYSGRYSWDAFKEWTARWTASVGLGYQAIDEEDMYLTFRLGGGAVREYGTDEDEVRPEGLAAIEYKWNPSEGQEFYFDTTYYHDFSGEGLHRILSKSYYSVKLDVLRGLAFNVGVDNEYQAEVAEDFEHNDLKYYSSLSVEF